MECVKHLEKHLLQYYLATKHTQTRLTSNLRGDRPLSN